ncbi:hypothetical protein J3E69DRAFT_253111 [Trichoderma sp. SZMC 28015]
MNGESGWYTALHPDNLLLSLNLPSSDYLIQHNRPRHHLPPHIYNNLSTLYINHYIRKCRTHYLQAQAIFNTLHVRTRLNDGPVHLHAKPLLFVSHTESPGLSHGLCTDTQTSVCRLHPRIRGTVRMRYPIHAPGPRNLGKPPLNCTSKKPGSKTEPRGFDSLASITGDLTRVVSSPKRISLLFPKEQLSFARCLDCFKAGSRYF